MSPEGTQKTLSYELCVICLSFSLLSTATHKKVRTYVFNKKYEVIKHSLSDMTQMLLAWLAGWTIDFLFSFFEFVNANIK